MDVPVDLAVDLADEDLHLVRLHLLGEDRRQRLGVGVGEVPSLDVLSPVGVPTQVREPDAGDPQILELAVLADAGERDPVVDLADLVQGRAGVLGDEQQPVRVLEPDHRASARDALVRVLRPVLHHLVGRDVRHERHQASLLQHGGDRRRDVRPRALRRRPSAVTATTIGKIRRVEVGAAGRDVVLGRVDQRLDRDPHAPRRESDPARQRFFSEFFAGCAPEPVVW